MRRLYVLLQVLPALIITLLTYKVGRSAAGGSSSGNKGGKKGFSGGRGAGADTPSQACWMKVEDFLTTFVGPQGWEHHEPVYAAQHDCSKKEKCVGIKRFHPFNKTTSLEEWKDSKILYYPPGQLSWIDVQEKSTKGKPLNIGESSKGKKTFLCRFSSEISHDLILGTYSKGETKCTVESKGKSKSKAPFQTLVINSDGKSAGLEPNVEDCPPKATKTCKDGSSKVVDTPKGRKFVGQPKAPTVPAERQEFHDDEICWMDYTDGVGGPGNKFNESYLGEPLGKERGDNVYLARVIWGEKLNTHVAFGKFNTFEHMLYIIGCNKPDPAVDRLHVEFLFVPNGTISWAKTNQTKIVARSGFPANSMVLGSIPGIPYALLKRRTCFSICQPDVQKDFINEVPLGIVDSATGYCEAVFRGKLVRYSEFWIPIDQHIGKFQEIGRCPKKQKSETTSSPKPPSTDNNDDTMLTFDGYSIPNPGFTQTGFNDDIYIECCSTWAANQELAESRH